MSPMPSVPSDVATPSAVMNVTYGQRTASCARRPIRSAWSSSRAASAGPGRAVVWSMVSPLVDTSMASTFQIGKHFPDARVAFAVRSRSRPSDADRRLVEVPRGNGMPLPPLTQGVGRTVELDQDVDVRADEHLDLQPLVHREQLCRRLVRGDPGLFGALVEVALQPDGQLLGVLLEPLAEQFGEPGLRAGHGDQSGEDPDEARIGDVLGEGQADVLDHARRRGLPSGPAQPHPPVVGDQQQGVPGREQPLDRLERNAGDVGDDRGVDVVERVQPVRADGCAHGALCEGLVVLDAFAVQGFHPTIAAHRGPFVSSQSGGRAPRPSADGDRRRRRADPLAHPHEEPGQGEDAVEDVHQPRCVVPGGEQQRHADQVDRHPDEPELDPPLGHAVGGEQRADEDPGVAPHRFVGSERAEDGGQQGGAADQADDEQQAGPPGGPVRVDHGRRVLGAVRPPVPAVDAHDDEHDLTARLAEQVDGVGGVEQRTHEDGEEQGVADQSDRPGPDLATHAAEGAEQPEDVADHLTPQHRLVADDDLRVEQPTHDVHGPSSFPPDGATTPPVPAFLPGFPCPHGAHTQKSGYKPCPPTRGLKCPPFWGPGERSFSLVRTLGDS
ncbi:hypothetical protein CURTO8I2_150271 [Curtobacterium sp. 8I-2]|nr:hypothetical protein CURTO8I2_150271 [Curtobacterium sp. 8I-2]